MSPFDDDWAWIRKQLEEQRRVLEPLRGVFEEQQRALAPFLKEQELATGAYQRLIREQERFYQPALEAFRQLEAGMQPFLQAQHLIAAGLSRFIAEQQSSAVVIAEALTQWQRLVETDFAGLDWASIRTSHDGDTSLGPTRVSGRVSAEEIQAELTELQEHVASATTQTEYLERLGSFLKQVSPAVRVILFFIFTEVILSFIVDVAGNVATPLLEKWWKGVAGRPPQEACETISMAAREAYGADQLQGYRLVRVEHLTVRAGAGRSHTKVAVLPLGKVVQVLTTSGSWVQRVPGRRGKHHPTRVGVRPPSDAPTVRRRLMRHAHRSPATITAALQRLYAPSEITARIGLASTLTRL